jgi:hypothetical protein
MGLLSSRMGWRLGIWDWVDDVGVECVGYIEVYRWRKYFGSELGAWGIWALVLV